MSVSKKARNVPSRWLGAFKKGHRYSSREQIDEDLAWELLNRWEKSKGTDKEAEAALDYLTKFNNEFHKNVVSKTDPLHKCTCPNRKRGDKHLDGCLRNDLNDRENAKNRDIMSVQNRNIEPDKDNAQYEEFYDGFNPNPSEDKFFQKNQGSTSNYVEDAMIELLDAQAAIDDMEDDTEH